jgi:hypothetical protein
MGKNNLRLSSGNSIIESRSSQTKRGSGGADHASGDRRRRRTNMGTNRHNDHSLSNHQDPIARAGQCLVYERSSSPPVGHVPQHAVRHLVY